MNGGGDIYNYSPAEIDAMFEAYRRAPDDTTVGELRKLMDAAAEEVRANR